MQTFFNCIQVTDIKRKMCFILRAIFCSFRFEESLGDFQNAFTELRGNQLIDYKPLGLRYKLYACEVNTENANSFHGPSTKGVRHPIVFLFYIIIQVQSAGTPFVFVWIIIPIFSLFTSNTCVVERPRITKLVGLFGWLCYST